jgi:hypothetical protein
MELIVILAPQKLYEKRPPGSRQEVAFYKNHSAITFTYSVFLSPSNPQTR